MLHINTASVISSFSTSSLSICCLRHSFFKSNSILFLIRIWLCWVFVAARGLSLVVASRGYSLVAVRGLLLAVASLVAELPCSMWNLPRPGMEPWFHSQTGMEPCPLNWQVDSPRDHQEVLPGTLLMLEIHQ